jgi:peptidoglycan/xylan/chitin deacetylase (PgdA/CDA1 family)
MADIRAALPSTAERPPRLYLNWEEIRCMREFGVEFGSHTATHPNLLQLDPEAQFEELARSAARLAEMGIIATSLAYPFGNYNASAEAAALRANHRSIMLVGGVNRPLNMRRVGRTTTAGVTTEAELFAEMEIVAPVRSWLKRRLSRRPAVDAGA